MAALLSASGHRSAHWDGVALRVQAVDVLHSVEHIEYFYRLTYIMIYLLFSSCVARSLRASLVCLLLLLPLPLACNAACAASCETPPSTSLEVAVCPFDQSRRDRVREQNGRSRSHTPSVVGTQPLAVPAVQGIEGSSFAAV